MTPKEFSACVKGRGLSVPQEILNSFISNADKRWFEAFEEELLVRHLQCAASLSHENPFALHLETKESFQLSVVTWDFKGLFSLITGILASSGFSIDHGETFSVKIPPSRNGFRSKMGGGLSGDLVIDVFSGTIQPSVSKKEWFRQIQLRFKAMGELANSSRPDRENRRRAHALVQKWVADDIEKNPGAQSYLPPMEFRMDNSNPDCNRMQVVSEDTPYFLYALGSALSQESVTIERVAIRTDAGQIEDVLDFTDDSGRKITDINRLNRIKMGILLTKQFTYFINEAPDPTAAFERFDLLVRDITENDSGSKWFDFLRDPLIMKELALLLGASDFLWEDFIRQQYESLLPVLQPHVRKRLFSGDVPALKKMLEEELSSAESWEDKKKILNEFKDRMTFNADMDHILVDDFDFRTLSWCLTLITELVFQKAAALSEERQIIRYGRPRGAAGMQTPWALFGLGKLGGSALGYASDIELLFVYSDSGFTDGENQTTNADYFERLLRDMVSLIDAKKEGIFQVDLRLRPYGRSGILASSLEAFCAYYARGGEASSLEKLSLVRLRAIAGDPELGERVERIRDSLIYAPESINRIELDELRRRQIRKKTKPGRLNAKYSIGALLDLESTVQILQSEHGFRDESLRTPSVHAALKSLGNADILNPEESLQLSDAYDFFRNLINALRMLRGSAIDLDLPNQDSDEFRHLARRMGYRTKGVLSPERRLQLDFKTQTAHVRAFMETVLGQKSVSNQPVRNMADLVLSEGLSEDVRNQILFEAGFRNPQRAFENLKSLAGTGRRREIFSRLIVLATDMTYQSADPDMSLNNWERFVSIIDDPEDHFNELLAQPSRMEILHKLLAGSQFLADSLVRDPELFNRITDPERIRRFRDIQSYKEELLERSQTVSENDDWRDELRTYRRQEILRIGTRDLALGYSLPDIMMELSNLAEAIIETVLERILEFRKIDRRGYCILAFGKLGGEELNYSSDVDILGISETPGDLHPVQETLARDLSTATAEGTGYRVDMRLRPWGRSGHLVQSMDSILRYYRDSASQWEIQALLKLRPIAGDRALGDKFLNKLNEFLQRPVEFPRIVQAIESNRAAALAQRSFGPYESEIDIKNGRGGIRDIEFLVQGLQLRHIREHPDVKTGNTLYALEKLKTMGALNETEWEHLSDDYILLRRIEHILQLFDDRQVHHLPCDPERLTPIARRILSPESDYRELGTLVEETQKRVFEYYRSILLDPAGITVSEPLPR